MIEIVGGFIMGIIPCFTIIYVLYKRVRELEKALFIKNDLSTYSIMKHEKLTKQEKESLKKQEEQRELEKKYRDVMLQNTVSDEDINLFGEKEPVTV